MSSYQVEVTNTSHPVNAAHVLWAEPGEAACHVAPITGWGAPDPTLASIRL